MTPHHPESHVSDVRLERYRLGELPPEELEALRARIAGEPALRERLEALGRSDRELARAYPGREMAERIAARARESTAAPHAARGPRGWLVPATVAATCVCVAAVAASLWMRGPAGGGTVIKGGGEPSLLLYRKVPTGSEELRPGAVARQGDQIRVGYRASGRRYGVILSVDGRGVITQHLPRGGDRAAPVEPSGTKLLDFAYELDEAPRWETFYFVASDAPFLIDDVRRAVGEAEGTGDRPPGVLRLPATLAQCQFRLEKDGRR
jgi:hypothetical protein